MNKIDFEIIAAEISNMKFPEAISRLNKIHDNNDVDYLYLRSLLYFKQKNFYLSLDTLINCLQRGNLESLLEKKILNLLDLNFISIERSDLSKILKDNSKIENIKKNLISWLN